MYKRYINSIIIIIIIIIIPVRDAIVFPRERTKVIRIRYLWTRMLFSVRYEYTRPEVWAASFSASYKSTVRFLVTNSEEGRSLCRKMHAKLRSVVFNLSTRCCVHLLLSVFTRQVRQFTNGWLANWMVGGWTSMGMDNCRYWTVPLRGDNRKWMSSLLCLTLQVKDFIGQELLAHLYSTGNQVRESLEQLWFTFEIRLVD